MIDYKSELWLPLGKALDKPYLGNFNAQIASGYRSVLVPLLSQYLNRRVSESLQVLPRQSTLSGQGFNPLFSDLDLAIVFNESVTLQSIDLVRSQIEWLRRFFPFLGEVEIFTSAEWSRRELILKLNHKCFSLIRNLRKALWLRNDLDRATNAYQIHKLKRALKRLQPGCGSDPHRALILILQQLEHNFIKPKSSTISELKLDPNRLKVLVPALNTDHLGWTSRELLNHSRSPIEVWWLAAVTPCRGENPEAQEVLSELRKGPLSLLYCSYLEAEWLQIKAVYRARPSEFPWMGAWADQLNEQLAEFCPRANSVLNSEV